jgi:ABC-2 type transport system ATP-binding protein
MIRAKNLWRFYGATPAVAGLDMEVPRGSAYGFIGPNGAGKSTTLRILATLDRPHAGSLEIGGLDVDDGPEKVRPKIGYMPDPFELYDDMTVEEHLSLFAFAYRVEPKRREHRVEAAIELARVSERRKEKVGQLSKGWRQRVLLAQTLVHDPDLLLLDEPASGLDPAARIEFREIVLALRSLGKTIVVSSHILSELAGFCDAVGIVEAGRMLASGKIDDILRRFDPTTRLEVEIAGDVGAARVVLERQPSVERVEVGPRPSLLVAHARLPEELEARAAILAALVGAGVRVASFTMRKDNLEDLFLKVAAERGPENVERREALLATLRGTPARSGK